MFLKEAVRIAQVAGAFLLKHHRRPKKVSHKSERVDLVTNIDTESEARVVRALRRAFPDHDIVGEETPRPLTGSPFRWYIDPLDGTVNYVHGLPIFSISIGLVENGRPRCGVVYAPAIREMFTGELGRGSFRNGRRMRVSTRKNLRDAFLVTGFPYDEAGRRRQNDVFTRFILLTQAIRRIGCASIDLCYTACGIFDGFWELGLKPWDLAAGVLFVEEAGGRVTDFSGRRCSLDGGEVVSTNGRVHDAMLHVIGERRQ